jgi:hypothetical protein
VDVLVPQFKNVHRINILIGETVVVNVSQNVAQRDTIKIRIHANVDGGITIHAKETQIVVQILHFVQLEILQIQFLQSEILQIQFLQLEILQIQFLQLEILQIQIHQLLQLFSQLIQTMALAHSLDLSTILDSHFIIILENIVLLCVYFQ